MPEGTRVARCVSKVKAKGGGVNPYAVCQHSTGQSYATGKSLKKKKKKKESIGDFMKRRNEEAEE